MSLFRLILAVCLGSSLVFAHANYIGYSGAPGRQNCASSCHGQDGGTIVVNGFPQNYTPGETYQVVVGHRTAGTSILNFNASCRVGLGSDNAGTIDGGTLTETYNVEGETNGVHLSETDQDQCSFSWTAPPAGTGDVRLYLAGHQGPFMGPNTDLVLTATEGAGVPGAASNPVPADQAQNLCFVDTLHWTAGAGATSHDVYFGDTNPPDSVGNVSEPWLPVQVRPGWTYYWQIVERNAAGTTPGPVWRFSILGEPEAATNLHPQFGATNVPVNATLFWQAGARAVSHDVYLGLVSPPDLVQDSLADTTYTPAHGLLPDTTYYWYVIERNACGELGWDSQIWRFRTEHVEAAGDRTDPLPKDLSLGPVYPNPFNATVTIPFALPQASKVMIAIYDVTGRQVALMASGNYAAGIHRVQFSSEGIASGIYFVRLEAGEKMMMTKVVALK